MLYTRVSYGIYLVSGRKFQIFISGSSQLISSMEKQICFTGSFKEKSPANGLIMCVGASGMLWLKFWLIY